MGIVFFIYFAVTKIKNYPKEKLQKKIQKKNIYFL
jgi:hypothetical protein